MEPKGASVYVLRLRQPDLARPYRTLGYPLTPAAYLCVSLWTLFDIVRARPLEAILGLAVIGSGLLFYLLTRDKRSDTHF